MHYQDKKNISVKIFLIVYILTGARIKLCLNNFCLIDALLVTLSIANLYLHKAISKLANGP